MGPIAGSAPHRRRQGAAAAGRTAWRRLCDNEFLARWGDEEFLLLDDVTPTRALTDKLRQTVEKIGFHFRRLSASITVSLRRYRLPRQRQAGIAVERAAQALYQAKRGGL